MEWEPDSSSVCAHRVTWAGAGPSWAPFMSGGRGGGGQPSGEQQGRNASRWHSPQGHPAPHTQQRRGPCWLSQVGGAWYRHLAGSCQGCCYAPARHRAAPTEKDWVLGSTVGISALGAPLPRRASTAGSPGFRRAASRPGWLLAPPPTSCLDQAGPSTSASSSSLCTKGAEGGRPGLQRGDKGRAGEPSARPVLLAQKCSLRPRNENQALVLRYFHRYRGKGFILWSSSSASATRTHCAETVENSV